ncbi:hypothetical protein SEA_LILBEANIE_79 [Gordonia phage Lilbeanie]|uniref:Uncharacterized protein n=1 Tax=Gordonia phage Lilbeanie TaxID=2794947 RepID=A0A7T1KSE5_9CAUD|nr:hypothetical protein J1773_gp79 [Gordonia phage Lilbeanie]QPO17157.1 hypothetical protein SEA_LILBEANIE_79 [Gordonia phage Lilbeanie]
MITTIPVVAKRATDKGLRVKPEDVLEAIESGDLKATYTGDGPGWGYIIMQTHADEWIQRKLDVEHIWQHRELPPDVPRCSAVDG